MRILIATAHRGVVGGVETYLRALIPRLVAVGHEVATVCARDASPGQQRIDATVGDRVRVAKSPVDFVRIAESADPHVVLSHGLPDPEAEHRLADRFPTVLFAHDYHGTCVSGTKCHARPGYDPCRRTLGFGCLLRYFPRRCGGRNPLVMLSRYREQRQRVGHLDLYRAVLVASRHMADEYRRHGVADDQLRIVPLFPTGGESDRDPPAIRPRSDRVLFVGRLTELKGVAHLPAAIAVATKVLGRRLTLVVAGDGPDRGACEAECRRRGLSAEFLGWVDPARRDAEMRAADLLAVPSVWPEPFGLVGVEAGCVGLPAVAYSVGGISDWLEPGVSGESAPGDRPDPRGLAAAIVRALSDPTHWQSLRVGAWETARRFNPEAHLDRLIPILEAARS